MELQKLTHIGLGIIARGLGAQAHGLGQALGYRGIFHRQASNGLHLQLARSLARSVNTQRGGQQQQQLRSAR